VVRDFSRENSVLNTFIAEIRDSDIQQDSMRFRRNLERIGEVIAYELSQTLEYLEEDVVTPLGEAKANLPSEDIVLATILRAGLPLHQGMLNVFDRAENAFISAYRKYYNDKEYEIEIEYLASPSIEGKVLVIADPMLATGHSVELVFNAMKARGVPKKVHVVSAIASAQGIGYVRSKLPIGTQVWAGAVDVDLTAKAYIVPGLGDAGDLAYGMKE
jgi:uracil phosphoribosyltransferase